MSKVAVGQRPQVTADDVQTFAQFLSRYMRHLIVRTSSYFLKSQVEAQEANRLLNALLAAIPSFIQISRMTLTGDAMFTVFSSHPEIKLPNISHFTVYRAGEVFPIKTIYTFTNLRVLHFIGVSLDFNDTSADSNCDPSEIEAPIPLLEELALQLAGGPFAIFMEWVGRRKALDLSHLKTLKISISDSEPEKRWFTKQLVPLVGTSLKTLDIHFYSK